MKKANAKVMEQEGDLGRERLISLYGVKLVRRLKK